METELEAKFLNIEPDVLRAQLAKQGAALVYAERMMKRKNFDYPDKRLEKIGGWIRLRDEGDKITLAYKRVIDRTLEGTKEICVNVNDFDKATNLLIAIGLDQKSYQETKREKWLYNDVEITIDTWPWIPTFVEFEGSTEEKLRNAVDAFGFDWSEALHGSVEVAYQRSYDVSEEEIDSWETITFIPIPDWLEIRRKIS